LPSVTQPAHSTVSPTAGEIPFSSNSWIRQIELAAASSENVTVVSISFPPKPPITRSVTPETWSVADTPGGISSTDRKKCRPTVATTVPAPRLNRTGEATTDWIGSTRPPAITE
jgi:hypothetical protein